MSEMQEMIMESVTKLFDKYSTKEVINESENGRWAQELWEQLVENGMVTVAIPEELGGNGGDYSDALSILRLAGKYSAPIPLAETYLANWILMGLGENVTDEITTVSCSKDVNPIQLQKNGDGWVVFGSVKQVPWARFAKKLLVMGETSEGSIVALIPLKNAKIIQGENLAGEARDEVIFNNVYLHDCKTIKVDGVLQKKNILYGGALTRTAMMAGALENIMELTVQYTNERSQFGRPIHRFQAVQQHLAMLAGETAAASTAANCAVDSYGKDLFTNEIAFAKIRVNEAAGKASSIAHQVLAAIGFTYEHTLHHSSRRLWSWRDEFGTETDWEQIVTEQLVTLKQDGLWSMITGNENKHQKVEL
ncbi:acyl-CoA dehydrogenase [Neobacillus niacini]|uniref:acyl-CoA dehydrogenase family protein n=1 Tax=Neobacillus niacini TaxID=86668 RepID=UPI0027801A44|nr:acyl-CoA dehydrogenase family protein [Neobacillus niacini]MDQ1002166.1 acyl-CoA dehydrogenase [Neobacillus niacini]